MMILAHGPMLLCPQELALVLSIIPGAAWFTYVFHRVLRRFHG